MNTHTLASNITVVLQHIDSSATSHPAGSRAAGSQSAASSSAAAALQAAPSPSTSSPAASARAPSSPTSWPQALSPSASLACELQLPSDVLTHSIIGAAIQVHRALGPGLLEALYERAMCVALERREIPFRSQVPIPMTFEGQPIGNYYADLVIADRVIVELKSVGKLQNAHLAQMLTYLRITNLRLGLLINFNEPVLHQGVRRVIR
jgi:GxxExxY protein